MVDNAVPTLDPTTQTHDVLDALSVPPAPSITSEKKALFESIARDESTSMEDEGDSSLKMVFAGLLWFGYAIAIVVALILVWSAANGLVKSLPR
jgi:hypothetical protein